MQPVRLVIVGVIIVIFPLITLLLLVTHLILALVFDLVACISAADDIMQVAVVSAMPSIAHLWWSDAAGRVPMGTTPMVVLMSPVHILLVMK
jgi:hypothetical protein